MPSGFVRLRASRWGSTQCLQPNVLSSCGPPKRLPARTFLWVARELGAFSREDAAVGSTPATWQAIGTVAALVRRECAPHRAGRCGRTPDGGCLLLGDKPRLCEYFDACLLPAAPAAVARELAELSGIPPRVLGKALGLPHPAADANRGGPLAPFCGRPEPRRKARHRTQENATIAWLQAAKEYNARRDAWRTSRAEVVRQVPAAMSPPPVVGERVSELKGCASCVASPPSR